MRDLIITETPPKVVVLGVSRPNEEAFEEILDYRGEEWGRDPFVVPESIAVFAGSVCYKSHANKAGRSDTEYLRKSIIEHKHGSVLEHVVVNFAVASVPRSVQLELVRHRAGAAYSWLSQRFTDKFTEFVVPPLLRKPEFEEQKNIFLAQCVSTYNTYHSLIESIDPNDMTETGTLRRKRIKEAVRGLLNNATGSDGVVSYNARAIRHIIQLRTDPAADESIREFCWQMFLAANSEIPDLLQDANVIVQDWGAPQVVFEGEGD